MSAALLPRATVRELLLGRGALVGSRLDARRTRGVVSPIEAQLHMGLVGEDLAKREARSLEGLGAKQTVAVLARVALSGVLAPSSSLPAPARVRLLRTSVDNLTEEDFLARFFAPSPGRARLAHFVHPHALNLAYRDDALRDALHRADLVLPDGVGLRLAGRIVGRRLRQNLNGTDLLPRLCAEAAARGLPLVLVGAAEGVAARCAEALRASTPGLAIARAQHGFLTEEDSLRLAAELREAGPALVLVGMGSPRQELWARRYLASIPGLLVLTVGGLFDFYSGRIPRAPVAWRELGLEWAWRLRCEPRRMAQRYLVGNPLFLFRAALQRARG